MTFTDEDLKRLKEQVRVNGVFAFGNIKGNELLWLLGRLEAAEEYIDQIEINGFADEATSRAANRWRERAGKSA